MKFPIGTVVHWIHDYRPRRVVSTVRDVYPAVYNVEGGNGLTLQFPEKELALYTTGR